MARHPKHVGVSKGWLTWNSQNLNGFEQQQPYTVVQDEVVRRFIRGFFPSNLIGKGNEVGISHSTAKGCPHARHAGLSS